MKLLSYLKDKLYAIILWIIFFFFSFLLLLAFRCSKELIIAILCLHFLLFLPLLLIDYFRKRNFYQHLFLHIQQLDKSYLVLETIDAPNFYEGELLVQILYEMNKSMCENVNIYQNQMNNFKEYIEMWIHEIKIPLASINLMNHNHPNQYDKKMVYQLKRIEDSVEQVLYYVRAENAEKDYLIQEVCLDKIVAQVALKNKDDLLENKIDLRVENTNFLVSTDSKWMVFILNQILNNSIKYKKETSSYVSICAKEDDNCIIVTILDNGIGILATDLPLVFEKSFTGKNGRSKIKSTGMGLFIVKSMCEKLGHQITIESKVGEYTKVSLIFYKNSYFDVIK